MGLRYCGRFRAEKGAPLEGEVHGGRGEEGEERGQPEMGLGKSCSMMPAPRGTPAPPQSSVTHKASSSPPPHSTPSPLQAHRAPLGSTGNTAVQESF